MINYNDYELIYLVQCHYDQTSLKIIFDKYKAFIYKVALSKRIYSLSLEDLVHLGLVSLKTAIESYSELFNKTFMRFFELIYIRRLSRELKSAYKKAQHITNIDHEIIDNVLLVSDNMEQYSYEQEKPEVAEIQFKNKDLALVYSLTLKGLKPSEIAKQTGFLIKRVYNLLARIRQGIKNSGTRVLKQKIVRLWNEHT